MDREKLSRACVECGAQCCRYIATEIDEPTCKGDYDNVRWYLLHRHVNVFEDLDGKWFLEFETDCMALDDDGRCGYYDQRPRICREHGDPNADVDCEFLGEESPYKRKFRTIDEFEGWLAGRGVDWRWKDLSRTRSGSRS